MIKMNTISKKLIKPHTPTPPNLKNYKISFIDSYMVPMNFAAILFYDQWKPQNQNQNQQLQESLAQTLVEFYPVAGRYMKQDQVIDCSDQGVEFVEAEALDMELTDLLETTELEQLSRLLPDHYFRPNEAADPLMSIQATHFLRGGGLAIAISVYHRVFDGASLSTFVAAWANATNPNRKKAELPSPSFDLPSLLPYKEHDFGVTSDQVSPEVNNINVVKRVFFDRAAVQRLESRIGSNGPVSRARVVCAFLAETLIRTDQAARAKFRDLVILQPVNMRGRTIPPQPKHACGNLLITSITRRVAASEAEGIGMEELVEVIGGAVRKSIVDHAEIFSPFRDGRDMIIKNWMCMIREAMDLEANVVVFTDWSKFGFYEVDFGWGKPVWTSTGPQRPYRNTVVIMSNREGDGIEAWVHLNQDDMRCFEQDEEIKLFTNSN